MLRILENSMIRFDIAFTIPAHYGLDYIVVKDQLIDGLEYPSETNIMDNIYTFQINNEPHTMDLRNYFTPILSKDKNNYLTTLQLTSTPKARSLLLQSTKPVSIVIGLNVWIRDISLFRDTGIQNQATVNGYQSSVAVDTNLISIVNGEFKNYKLFYFGSGYTMDYSVPADLIFPFYLSTFDGYSAITPTDNLPQYRYVLRFKANPSLNVNYPTLTTDNIAKYIQVYLHSDSGSPEQQLPYSTTNGYQFNFTLYKTDQTFELTIPHYDQLRSSTLYIVFTLENMNLPSESSPILSPGNAYLLRAEDLFDPQIIQSTSDVVVTTSYMTKKPVNDPSENIV